MDLRQNLQAGNIDLVPNTPCEMNIEQYVSTPQEVTACLGRRKHDEETRYNRAISLAVSWSGQLE